MGLKLARIVVFTNNLTTMTAFYRSVLDLEVVIDEKGYKELDGGGCRIALQSGSSKVGMKAPKLVFFAPDVESQRERLVRRGAKFMPVITTDEAMTCDGRDPDGNPIGLSNRV